MQTAVVHEEGLWEGIGQLLAMGHDDEDVVFLAVQIEQQLADDAGAAAVEVAGGFVGEEQDGRWMRARATATR
jgi:hypothetical protein